MLAAEKDCSDQIFQRAMGFIGQQMAERPGSILVSATVSRSVPFSSIRKTRILFTSQSWAIPMGQIKNAACFAQLTVVKPGRRYSTRTKTRARLDWLSIP